MQFAYSGFVEQALARYTQGCQAIESGNLVEAAARFNQSSTLNPSVEALVDLAEVQIALGQWDEAVTSASAASHWARELKPNPHYAIKLKQLTVRFKSESRQQSALPPFSQQIEIIIQSKLNTRPLVQKLVDIAGISTDGASTLKGKQLFYDMVIGKKPDDWDDSLEIMAQQQGFSSNELMQSRHQKNCLYLNAPLMTVAQNIPSQLFLAQDILNTLVMLGPQIEPLFIRIGTSGVTHTPERLYKFASGNAYLALINTFTLVVRDDDGGIFTSGMHALGYADAKMSAPVVHSGLAISVLHEFLECTLVNNILPATEVMMFGSAAAQFQFSANPGPFSRSYLGSTAFNPNGLWTLTPAARAGS